MPKKRAVKPKVAKKKKAAPKGKKPAVRKAVVVRKKKVKFVTKPVKRIIRRKHPAPVIAPLAISEVTVEESKYFIAPVGLQDFPAPEEFQIPGGYGDNKIVLMVRDPHWLFTYWELRREDKATAQAQAGRNARECLRIYKNHAVCFDVEIGGMANNWYLDVPEAGASYWVEIGFRSLDGRFFAVARSNTVTTPLDRMSDIIDEEWMIPDWDALYALSGGFGIGHSSAAAWGFSLFSPTRARI